MYCGLEQWHQKHETLSSVSIPIVTTSANLEHQGSQNLFLMCPFGLRYKSTCDTSENLAILLLPGIMHKPRINHGSYRFCTMHMPSHGAHSHMAFMLHPVLS